MLIVVADIASAIYVNWVDGIGGSNGSIVCIASVEIVGSVGFLKVVITIVEVGRQCKWWLLLV